MVKLFAKRVLILGARVNFFFLLFQKPHSGAGAVLVGVLIPNERERGGGGKCDQFKQMKRKNLFFDLKILTIARLRFLWAVFKWRGSGVIFDCGITSPHSLANTCQSVCVYFRVVCDSCVILV